MNFRKNCCSWPTIFEADRLLSVCFESWNLNLQQIKPKPEFPGLRKIALWRFFHFSLIEHETCSTYFLLLLLQFFFLWELNLSFQHGLLLSIYLYSIGVSFLLWVLILCFNRNFFFSSTWSSSFVTWSSSFLLNDHFLAFWLIVFFLLQILLLSS